MGHNYAITIGGVPLNTIATGLEGRFLKYTSGQRRGSNLVVPHQHGQYFVPDKYFDSSDVMLELFLPHATTDAAAEALSEVALLLSSQSLVSIGQTDPHRGSIRAQAELTTDPTPTQNNLIYLFGLNIPSGFWEDASTSNASGNPPSVTTGGDRPISDMVLDFSGTGYLEHTDPLGQVARITIESGAGGTTPYTVDVGAGTVVDAVSANKDAYLTVTQPYWMKWQPGAAQSLTSSVSVTATWRNKWS